MTDDKDRSTSTEVISTAASSRPGGKVRWSSATRKLETVPTEGASEAGTPQETGTPQVAGASTDTPVQDSAESEAPVDQNGLASDPKIEPTSEPSPEPARRKRFSLRSKTKILKNKATEIPVLVFLAFAIAIIIKTFLVQAFYIPSTSMLPTLRTGDRVLVEKLSYRFTDPDRGDVVVFEKSVFGAKKDQDLPWYQDAQGFFRELLGLPTGTKEDYIKRIVAVSGDVIEYKGRPRKLLINGEKVDQPFIYRGKDTGSPTLTSADCERLKMQKAGSGCRVPAGRVFVMGDNRGNSEDSRILGPVDEEKIVGRAFVIIWPPSDFGGL